MIDSKFAINLYSYLLLPPWPPTVTINKDRDYYFLIASFLVCTIVFTLIVCFENC